MKKVILTGFQPFADYKLNPTEGIVNYYNGRLLNSHEHIVGVVLPCTYFGAFEILSKIINDEKPNAIISLGFSSSVKGIRIETTFRNLMNSKYPDATGFNPDNQQIDSSKNNRQFLSSFADNTFLANILYSKNIPVELSSDADFFICNSLGYLTTKKIIDEDLRINNMFVHIPWTDDYEDRVPFVPNKIFLELDKVRDAVEILIEDI